MFDLAVEKIVFNLETQHEDIKEEVVEKVLEDIEKGEYSADLSIANKQIVLTIVTNDGVEILFED